MCELFYRTVKLFKKGVVGQIEHRFFGNQNIAACRQLVFSAAKKLAQPSTRAVAFNRAAHFFGCDITDLSRVCCLKETDKSRRMPAFGLFKKSAESC